jgi:hypothetical protein
MKKTLEEVFCKRVFSMDQGIDFLPKEDLLRIGLGKEAELPQPILLEIKMGNIGSGGIFWTSTLKDRKPFIFFILDNQFFAPLKPSKWKVVFAGSLAQYHETALPEDLGRMRYFPPESHICLLKSLISGPKKKKKETSDLFLPCQIHHRLHKGERAFADFYCSSEYLYT